MSTSSLAVFSASFESEFAKHTEGKKQVSDRLYHFLHMLVLVMAICSIAFAATYAIQLGEGLWFKLVIAGAAVGIECALIFFAATMYPKPVLLTASSIAGIGVVLISIFTAASFLLSQQYAADHKVAEMEKEYLSHLQSNLTSVEIESIKNRGTIAKVSDRIERGLERLQEHKGSKATAIYHAVAQTVGYSVESVSLIIRLIWALVFVSTTIALASYLETVYCPSSLSRWADGLNKQRSVLLGLRSDYEAISLVENAPAKVPHEKSSTYDLVMNIPKADTEGKLPSCNPRYRRTRGGGDYISETMYQRVKKAVLEGTLTPTVTNLRKATRGMDRAYQAIDRLLREGVIFQKSNGRYALAT
jgi:ABC-type multidrug transport system fused ATPase/permease subunit